MRKVAAMTSWTKRLFTDEAEIRAMLAGWFYSTLRKAGLAAGAVGEFVGGKWWRWPLLYSLQEASSLLSLH